MNYFVMHVISFVVLSAPLATQPDQATMKLFNACQFGQKSRVLKCLQEGADANATDEDGFTPLYHAVRRENIEMVDLLLEYKADINKYVGWESDGLWDDRKMPVLMWALEARQKKMVDHLLSKGADTDIADSNGVPFICLVVEAGNLELLKTLVDNGADIHKRYLIEEKRTGTLLHIAVGNDHIKIAEYLLEKIVDIEAKTSRDCSPLNIAAYNRNLEMVKLLVQNGAYIYVTEWPERSLLELEPGKISSKILDYLRQVEKEKYNLDSEEPTWAEFIRKDSHPLAYGINLSGLKDYVDNAGQTAGKDHWGNLLLHYLAGVELRNTELLPLLVEEMGPDIINAANNFGCTPLHYAAGKSRVENVKFLLEHGADVHARDRAGNTPLNTMANYYFNGKPEDKVPITKMLLESGADVNARNYSGYTPLLRLADANMDRHLELTKLLIEHGADVNVKGNDYKTPLHEAAQMGTVAMTKIFLENGAEIDARDVYGKNSLDATTYSRQEKLDLIFKYKTDATVLEAVYYSQDKILEDLIVNGADIDMRTDDRFGAATGLIIAAENNDLKMVQKVLELNANINAQNNRENTALHYAAQKGHDDIIWFLLESGADINIKNKQQQTPFDLAVKNNRTRSVQIIKERFPDLEPSKPAPVTKEQGSMTPDDIEETIIEMEIEVSEKEIKAQMIEHLSEQVQSPFNKAVVEGNLELVQSMLKEKDIDVNEFDNLSSTPLLYASFLGHTDIAKLLLKSGAEANLQGEDRTTSLHLAVMSGNEDIAKLLIDAGADPSIKAMGQMNALEAAILNRQDNIAKMIQEKFPDLKADVDNFITDFAHSQENGFDPNKIEQEWKEQERQWRIDAFAERSDNPFHINVINSQIEQVRTTLKNGGVDINETDDAGILPITYAALTEQKDMVKLLLEHGADINKTDKNLHFGNIVGFGVWGHRVGADVGWSTLHYLVLSDNADMLEFMIAQGADVNLKNIEHQRSPAFLALYNNCIDEMKILTNAGADLTLLDHNGQTMFHVSALRNKVENIKLLLELGADIEVRDKGGETPLMTAAVTGEDDALIYLLEKGADVNAVDNKGNNALHKAVSKTYTSETIRIIIEHGIDIYHKNDKGLLPQFRLSGSGYEGREMVDNLQLLIDSGIDVRTLDHNGDSMLHYAFGPWKSVELAEMLIENGLDKDSDFAAINNRGDSMLHLAVGRDCSLELAKLAVDRGLNPNITDNKGRTPLHKILDVYSQACKSKELVRFLVESGADLDVVNSYGRTPLHNALILGWTDIAEYFIEKGADVNGQSTINYGLKTPLHCAVEKNYTDIVEALISYGAELDIQDKKENTALHYAAEKGYYDITKLLLDAGARYDIPNKKDQTALDLAEQQENNDIFLLFE